MPSFACIVLGACQYQGQVGCRSLTYLELVPVTSNRSQAARLGCCVCVCVRASYHIALKGIDLPTGVAFPLLPGAHYRSRGISVSRFPSPRVSSTSGCHLVAVRLLQSASRVDPKSGIACLTNTPRGQRGQYRPLTHDPFSRFFSPDRSILTGS